MEDFINNVLAPYVCTYCGCNNIDLNKVELTYDHVERLHSLANDFVHIRDKLIEYDIAGLWEIKDKVVTLTARRPISNVKFSNLSCKLHRFECTYKFIYCKRCIKVLHYLYNKIKYNLHYKSFAVVPDHICDRDGLLEFCKHFSDHYFDTRERQDEYINIKLSEEEISMLVANRTKSAANV